MKRKLAQPIIADELHLALDAIAKGKTSRLDGVVMDFFLDMWSIIGKEYTEMVQTSILRRHFPLGVTKGLITLLHRGRERKQLSN
jgi:hypothetical protein